MTHEEGREIIKGMIKRHTFSPAEASEFARAIGIFFNQYSGAKGFMDQLEAREIKSELLRQIAEKWIAFFCKWNREDGRFNCAKDKACKLRGLMSYVDEPDKRLFSSGTMKAAPIEALKKTELSSEEMADYIVGYISSMHPTLIQSVSGFLYLFLDRYYKFSISLDDEHFYLMPMI